jgi:hypothetical protein
MPLFNIDLSAVSDFWKVAITVGYFLSAISAAVWYHDWRLKYSPIIYGFVAGVLSAIFAEQIASNPAGVAIHAVVMTSIGILFWCVVWFERRFG